MDTTTAATTQSQWPPQEIVVVKPMEEIVKLSGSGERERKIRSKETVKGAAAVINCPRCNSTNTKFCYYNNYSLSQPRYFCKTCRRYWTEGGSLRNIPVGGGSRKNKRSSSSSSSPSLSSSLSSSSKKLPDLVQNPKILDSHDLNLGFALHHHNHHDFKAITDMIHNLPSASSPPPHHLSSLELLTGLQAATSRGLSSFMPTSGDHSAIFSTSGFALPEFKPSSLNFSLEGLGSGGGGVYGSFHGVEETNGKLLFPFEDLKQVSNSNGEQNRDQNNGGDDHNSNGYWNGVIGGGGSW